MLRLIAFGGLSLLRDGTPLAGPVAQRVRLALLALLATGREAGVPRDRVLSYLWPESDTERARGSLKQTIYSLRRDLGDDVIAGTADLRLNPAVITSDVSEFAAAIARGDWRAAVELHRGPFLEAVYLRSAPEFERWAAGERSRLESLYVAALEHIAQAADTQGDHAGAASAWRRLTTVDPLSTRYARALMMSLARAGNVGAALAAFRAHATAVEHELGGAPEAELQQLAREVASPRPHLPAGPRVAAAAEGIPEIEERQDVVARTSTPIPQPASHAWRSRRLWATIGAALAVVVLISVGYSRRTPDQREYVLVAPLENETGDSTFDVTGRMAADWITQSLGAAGLVDLVDFRTVLQLAEDSSTSDRTLRPETIAARAGVTTVVHGSMYRAGDSLRIHARIVRSDGRVLRDIDPVTVSAADPASALEPLRQRVLGVFAALVDRRFSPWQDGVSRPPAYDAYHEFMQGLENASAQRWDRATLHFARASELDTTFMQAKLLLAEGYGATGKPELADSVAKRVLLNRDRLSRYEQAALDRFVASLRPDWEASVLAARRMTEIAPRSADAWYVRGYAALASKRYAEARRSFDQIDLQHSWMRDWLLYWRWPLVTYHMLGDFKKELSTANRLRAKYPQDTGVCSAEVKPLAAMGMLPELDVVLGECSAAVVAPEDSMDFLSTAAGELRAHGHLPAADRMYQRAIGAYNARPRKPGERKIAGAAHIHYFAGRWDKAFPLYRELAEGDTSNVMFRGRAAVSAVGAGDRAYATSAVRWFETNDNPWATGLDEMWRGRIALTLGDTTAGIRFLKQAVAQGVAPAFFFHPDPALDPVRRHATFRGLFTARR